MSDILTWILVVLGVPAVAFGLVEFCYYPLALDFEISRHRGARNLMAHRHFCSFSQREPTVSVIVPAFNEDRVVATCVESILADQYHRKEVILVDDGSSDDTLAVLRRYEDPPYVTVLSQPNRGKAAALNTGIAASTGEILVFVDADGIFTGDSIAGLLGGFVSRRVGAVCGNDEPANLDRAQTRLLALLTHGTALVRRALAWANCLTIVSGNMGAFRRDVVDEVGGFSEGFIGEDLELTWRVHRAGYRVNFRPRALVYAEVPSTVGALWRQRVRWTRGLAQTARLHRDMLGTSRYGHIGWYLPFNVTAMLVLPVVQLVSLVLVGLLIVGGQLGATGTVLSAVALSGLSLGFMFICAAIVLDRAWRDLRYLYLLPLWPFYSLLMSLVTGRALLLEIRGRPSRWNKSDRTGVVSRGQDAAGSASGDSSRYPMPRTVLMT